MEKLDVAVMHVIDCGARDFTAIWRALDRINERVGSRDLDKALQRLRRRGDILVTGKPRGWQITKARK